MKLSAPPPPPPEPPEPGPAPGAAGDDAGDPVAGDPPADAAPPPVVSAPVARAPATWPEWYGGVDLVLAVLAVCLAFLLASFAARNSDVWLHLGAGKLLATGGYSPGSDPLSYTAAGRPWVNHSWLYDLGSYFLYQADGSTGFALVLAKALAAAVAFGLLIGVRRPGRSLWPWAAVATVAAVATAPRLTLSPLVGSVFFLAVTLFLVLRVPARAGSWRLPLAIGVTFWFWANVDGWFVLGPAALGLLLVGEMIRARGATGNTPADDPLGPLPDAATLARALLVGVVACMLNPHHVRVWQLPFELSESVANLFGASAIRLDPRLNFTLYSPLTSQYWESPLLGASWAGWAYGLLLAAGVCAVGLPGVAGRLFGARAEVEPLPLPHAVLWVGFAVLSLVTVYAVPFLAVVTVPVVASRLNALSATVALADRGERRTRLLLTLSGVGRAASVLGLLALCAAAWPGWVAPAAGSTQASRRVAWAVEPDPAVADAARQLGAWRAGGQLPPDARGFITSIDLANYCAWFAPGEKVFANGRFNHHRPEFPEFVAARRGLGFFRTGEPPDRKEAEAIFAARGVGYVAVSAGATEPDATRVVARAVAVQMWRAADRFAPWYIDGRTTVCGWRGNPAASPPAFDRLRVDPAFLAFGPGVEKLKPGKAELPAERGWWAEFADPPPAAAPGVDEAFGWIDYKQVVVQREAVRTLTASLLRLNVPGVAAPPIAQIRNMAGNELTARQDRFTPPHAKDGSSLAAPLLAVRAARRAIAASPDHPDGYYALSRALADADLPISEDERTLGVVTALRQCLTRLPPPADFRKGVYAASPTEVALRLAQLLLNPRPLNQKTVYFCGPRLNVSGVRELVGEMLVVQPSHVRRVPYGAAPNLPPGVQILDGPCVLALDQAWRDLDLANRYAAVEPTALGPVEQQAYLKELDEQRKQVQKELQRATREFTTKVERQPKLRDRVEAAREAGLVGESLDLLKSAEFEKEFGADAPEFALRGVALKLAVGRIEEAAADIAILKEALDKPGGEADPRARNLRTLVRLLDYHALVLAGDYAGAGAELEAAEGRGVRQGSPPPPDAVLRPDWLFAPPPVSFQPVLAAGLSLRFREVTFGIARQQIAAQLDREATFFFRRGYLSLLEGGIDEARARFAECRRPAPPGWDMRETVAPVAPEYLRLIEAAGKKAAAAP